MRWIIDGYNVMHAGGLIGEPISREGFRRARKRFLDMVARSFGAEESSLVTVVFDATTPPADMPVRGRYQGLSVLFAVGDENADARIEELILGHSHPKDLTVVSTDRRIRQAATRRKSKSLTADGFWEQVDHRLERRAEQAENERMERANSPAPADARRGRNSEESNFWLKEFGELDSLPEIQAVSRPHETLITDAEIADIEREVERELTARYGRRR